MSKLYPIKLPNGVTVELLEAEMRRLLALARGGLASRKNSNVPLTETEMYLDKVLNGERVKF